MSTNINDPSRIEKLIVATESLSVRPDPFQHKDGFFDQSLFHYQRGDELDVFAHIRLRNPETGYIWRRLALTQEAWVPEAAEYGKVKFLVSRDELI